jgi:hypothetical protein
MTHITSSFFLAVFCQKQFALRCLFPRLNKEKPQPELVGRVPCIVFQCISDGWSTVTSHPTTWSLLWFFSNVRPVASTLDMNGAHTYFMLVHASSLLVVQRFKAFLRVKRVIHYLLYSSWLHFVSTMMIVSLLNFLVIRPSLHRRSTMTFLPPLRTRFERFIYSSVANDFPGKVHNYPCRQVEVEVSPWWVG